MSLLDSDKRQSVTREPMIPKVLEAEILSRGSGYSLKRLIHAWKILICVAKPGGELGRSEGLRINDG